MRDSNLNQKQTNAAWLWKEIIIENDLWYSMKRSLVSVIPKCLITVLLSNEAKEIVGDKRAVRAIKKKSNRLWKWAMRAKKQAQKLVTNYDWSSVRLGCLRISANDAILSWVIHYYCILSVLNLLQAKLVFRFRSLMYRKTFQGQRKWPSTGAALVGTEAIL